MVKKPLFSPGELCGGTYEITDTIGADPFAETYAATHRRTRAAAEITCSRFDHIEGDAPSIEAFKASAERLQRLALDPVPRIYDYGVSEGIYWIASQVLDDPTILEFHARMDGKPGSWFVEDSLAAMISIVEILSAASSSGVAHGNLRPDLIVLRGLPNSCEPNLLELGFVDLFMLTPEAARATPRYRSPEQLDGAPVDARSDIYALGMCLYELIAKAPPYADKAPDSNSAALLEMALRELPTPLPELVTFCPDCVWRLIAKAIDKDPQKRFQAYGEFKEAISAALDQVMALHDPVNLADRGVEGQDLVEAFRAYLVAHGAAKGEATEATDTPRTLPPGVDTKRRVRAALIEARANVTEGAAPRVAAIASAVPPEAGPAPPPIANEDGWTESAPLAGTAPESLSTAPTPRLPVTPALVREAIPDAALPTPASAPTIAPIAAPDTVRVIAPLAASVAMPSATAIPPANTPASEPSASAREAVRSKERATARRVPWVAWASAAMLLGLAGLRAVPLLVGRMSRTGSAVGNPALCVASPGERGCDRRAAQPRSDDPPPRPIVVKEGRGAGQHSGVCNTLDWTVSSQVMTPSRRLAEE